ncbi:P-loop containing nucleoside triphosphate hydrolase [Pseudocohnilembus persalinus]|uniref:p-loop containing nucleoside triphosphate hydrolase n=1 Tax=Pseudocohnilembus persalinus TaxID=266149 RepID=A0A0V0QPI1_PSEPJ|nr:P-loop containing nucleoside triphosphate hydrolase [Pseudocohnilembus persalinus]|eukprot:KRX04146.1 P-loop containing nucleoside triphosphate hydrolase [Pseudocohnilembus persalinus]
MEPQKNKEQNSNKKQRPQSSCLLKKRQGQLKFNNNSNGYADDQKKIIEQQSQQLDQLKKNIIRNNKLQQNEVILQKVETAPNQSKEKTKRKENYYIKKSQKQCFQMENYEYNDKNLKDQTSVLFMSDYEFDDNEEININLNHNYPQSKQSVNSSKQDIIEKNIRFTKSLSPSKNKLNTISKTDFINKQTDNMQFNKSDDSQFISNNLDTQKLIQRKFTEQQVQEHENNDQQVQNECEENKEIENLENGNKKNIKKTSINSKQKIKLEKKKEKLEKKKEQERIIKEQRQKKKFEKQQQQKEQQQKIINETIQKQQNIYEENNKKMYRLEYQKIQKRMQNLDTEIQKQYQKLINTLNNIKQNKKCLQKMRQANDARQKYDQAIKQIQIEIEIMEQKLKNLPIIDSQNSRISFNAKNVMIKREQNIAAFFSEIEQNEQIRDYKMFYGPDKIYLLDHIQFKLGGNFVYSECALVFAFARKLGDDLVTYWCPIMDPYDLVESDGIICDDLQELLKEPMFQDMFDKYAYFMMDNLNQNLNQQENEQNQIKEIQIKTTQDDLSIEDYYIPFYKDLFEHQKQEVGWMFNCEQHPYINIKGNMICIPILDSGYYAIPDGENIKIIQKNDIQSVKLSNFGGILGSEIGSGKTASIIGLTSLGYQIDNFTEQMALQQTFQQEDQQSNIQIEEYKSQEEENENNKKEIQMNEQNQVFRDEQKLDQDDKFDLMSHDLQLHKKVFSRETGFHDNQLFKQDNLENKKIELLKTQLKQNFKNVYLPSLIIVTKNILYQWAEEYEKFAPFLKIKVVENSEDFLNLNIKEKIDSDQNKFKVLQDINILITHREAIIDIYQLDKTFSSQLFQINFRRVVYDEIHEITNIYDKRQKEKEYQPHKINNNLYTHIDLFYLVSKKLKTQFIWGMTGTLQNLNYRNNSESLALLLQLANPRSIVLPQLIKDVQYIDFDQIQKLLYRGKLENRQGEKYAREICSHFTSQFKHLENMQDQFEIAIDIIQKELNAQIFSIKDSLNDPRFKDQQKV